jgi:UDP-N-acetylmuramoyl-L-alanyl-D-glutamate--2,6-diaminopimelate ligase
MPNEPVMLSQLVRYISPVNAPSFEDTYIDGITLDSRKVLPGCLFVALPGGSTDGHRYIPDAIQRGAAAIVGSQSLTGLPVPYFQVENGREALADLSAAYFHWPSHSMTVIGVTGTDGKTTTCNLIFQILKTAGLPAGMISTVNAVIGDETIDTGLHVTTPEAPEIQGYLAKMVAAGITHVVIEATSHGLSQLRVGACEFDIAIVTNITHEHLDYHDTYQAYRQAKARLFVQLAKTPVKKYGNPRLAVLNRDDLSYQYLLDVIRNGPAMPATLNSEDRSSGRVVKVDYGLTPVAEVHPQEIMQTPHGIRFTAIVPDVPAGPGQHIPIQTNLFGDYNVANCLAAIAGTMKGLNISPQAVRDGIKQLESIPGRMEMIDLGQEFLAVVDFAHTPNALQNVLITVRKMVPGKVIAVFGSAGLRDRQKRRLMAETSARLSDVSVFTAEDPRTESLAGILEEMANGAESQGGIEGQSFWRIPDRGEALQFAVSLAKNGDVVIACGKGHEQSMCFGDTEYPWDDRVALRAILADSLGIPGPAVPYLPTHK